MIIGWHSPGFWLEFCRIVDNHPFHPCVEKNLVQAVMYNSISMDMVVGPVAKVEKIEDQLELFVDYARNFGVPQVNIQHWTPELRLGV